MRGIHENLPRRCKHSVVIPSDCRQDDPNPVCSICRNPAPLTEYETQQYRLLKKQKV